MMESLGKSTMVAWCSTIGLKIWPQYFSYNLVVYEVKIWPQYFFVINKIHELIVYCNTWAV